MNQAQQIRPAFVAFHLILGLALLWGSIHTLVHLGAGDLHAAIIGSLEAIGAIAFLIPKTLRLGAALLLVSIVGALLLHAARGEPRPDLLVYAAGVCLVAVHGSAYRKAPLRATA